MEKIGYYTEYGECVCGDSLELLEGLEDNSIDLVITSPPFALQRQKSYGNKDQDSYVDWLCEFGKKVFSKLKPSGSFVLDLGGAYEKGIPAHSLYQFQTLIKLCDEVGFKLAQPFYWHNPSALPSPIEWVNKRKIRAKSSVNTIWWLCKDPIQCKANVSKVLVPYSDRMKHLIEKPEDFLKNDETERPSGHVICKSSWLNDNGGAIPSNMLQIPNSESNSQYLRYCKAVGVKGHPARFPIGIPEFFIKMLTDEGDLVVDIFSGSNTTGYTAQKLHRCWKSFELQQEYVAASGFRFTRSSEESKEVYEEIMDSKFIKIGSESTRVQKQLVLSEY